MEIPEYYTRARFCWHGFGAESYVSMFIFNHPKTQRYGSQRQVDR
jgi:hypothetical protein